MNMNQPYIMWDKINEYISIFHKNRDIIESNSPVFLNKLREEALNNLQLSGFPVKGNEDYKYTDLSKVFNNQYEFNFSLKSKEFKISDVFKCDVPEINSEVHLLYNGCYIGEKLITKQPNGVIIGSFAQAIIDYPELVEEYYSKTANFEGNGLVSLNTMLVQDGFFMYVPQGVTLDRPIQFINVLSSFPNLMIQPRNLFIIEDKAQVKILICDHTLNSDIFCTNSVTEAYIGDNAHLDYYKIQNESNQAIQLSSLYVDQRRNSVTNLSVFTLHGGFVRNNLNVKLNGEGADNQTYGLYLTDNTQHVDNFTAIEHIKPNCTSNELFKGILDQESTGVFTGRIKVYKDAQKTRAFQANNNLLLTDTAKMRTKPQLEIYADDVKCSHGATVGQLDEDSLFYLRARGIAYKEARMLLMHAFTEEVIKSITIDSLKERMQELVEKRLRGELSVCDGCNMHCCKS